MIFGGFGGLGNVLVGFCRGGMHRFIQGCHILLAAYLTNFGQGCFRVILCFEALLSLLSILSPLRMPENGFESLLG